MDILSILALGKANKALKNGGGDTPSVEMFKVTFTHGYDFDTCDKSFAEIISAVDGGKYVYAVQTGAEHIYAVYNIGYIQMVGNKMCIRFASVQGDAHNGYLTSFDIFEDDTYAYSTYELYSTLN